jgi:glutaryl-CoA dehydrogenase
VLSTSGHIQALINPPSPESRASYRVSDDGPADGREFLEQVPVRRGSWWPDYVEWLHARSGELKRARQAGQPEAQASRQGTGQLRPRELRRARMAPATVPYQHLGAALATDYFLIREQFTDEQWEHFIEVRRFVDQEVLPAINEFWQAAELPWPLMRRLAELGLYGEDIEGHGCPGMSPLARGLVNMELHRGDGSLGTFLGVQSGLAMKSIDLLGSEEQKQRWLPAMARLEKVGAFALTEPAHGSDSVALETSARRDGEGWVLDGAKRWIGNGSIADVVVVWARSDEDGQVKGFLVEKDMPAFEPATMEGKGASRAIWQADIRLDGVRLPDASQLPGEGTFKDAGRVLVTTRTTCAWGRSATPSPPTTSRSRTASSEPSSASRCAPSKIVQDRLAKMLADVTGMQRYCMQLAPLEETGRLSDTIAGLAKLNNTRKARQVIAEARDLLGGNGVLLENHVIRHMGDIEVIHTYEAPRPCNR